MQCKERVDLLEALRESRKEAGMGSDEKNSFPREKLKLEKEKPPGNETPSNSPGWIGEGTVPPFRYPELSRPVPTLPARPAATSRLSSESMEKRGSRNPHESDSNTLPSPPTLPAISPGKSPSRLSSPERRKTMLTTLRTKGRKKKRSEERRVGKECRSRWSPYH